MKFELALCCCISSMLLAAPNTAAQDSNSISPSFDCARAIHEDEMAICSSRKLADLHVLISIGFTYLQHQVGVGKAKRIGAPCSSGGKRASQTCSASMSVSSNLSLTTIPENCPPGDERGKEYQTTNRRTGGSWNLPDSQHSCGGA